MTQIQSKKKFFEKSKNSSLSAVYVDGCLMGYENAFKVHRRDNSQTAKNYIKGLLKCEKGHANMERIEEEVDNSNYRAYHHFISNSKWDYQELVGKLSRDVSILLKSNKEKTGAPTGYIIDESAHLKKGNESVGVAKQYAGVAGKVENCQVGVYSSLVNDTSTTIINERLFLPKKWILSKEKCDKAEVPQENRAYRTKPELALEMIDEDIARGVEFDWIGGDGLYGHNFELTKGLDERGKLYVLDVHKDEYVYLEEPRIYIPEDSGGKGRKPEKLKAEGEPIRIDHYMRGLNHIDWHKAKVRKTAKGWLKVKVHVVDVWVWDGEEKKARTRTLIISQTKEKRPKVKYSFSNGGGGTYHPKEYAYFQAQRYWVERSFDDCKNELGMSDYQVRKWIGWHHHQVLVMLASLLLLKQKMDNEIEFPLMSIRDARILIICKMFGTEQQYKKRLEQMRIRHFKRQKDIDRHYRKVDRWEDSLKL
jgi:SRSO17 transposase